MEEAQRKIDQEIDSSKAWVRALRTRRNEFALVSRLPPEILSTIFKFAAVIEERSLIWVKVSHVCSQWRAVALECSSLWSRISLWSPIWAEEMLKRSKTAPLTASLHFLSPYKIGSAECLPSVLKQISRIRELEIFGPESIIDKARLADLSGPAPLLETLNLSRSPSGGVPTIPKGMLRWGTPRLRHLSIHKCHFDWDSSFLNGLTRLSIETDLARTVPSMNQLISALGKMPKLETLELAMRLPSPPTGVTTIPPSQSIITLSCLSSINIASNVLECAYLLNHLIYPATTSTKFICWVDPGEDYSCLCPALSHAGGSNAENYIHSLSLEYSSVSTRLRAWSSLIDDYQLILTPPRVHVELYWVDRVDGPEEITKALCMALPLKGLQSLYTRGSINFRQDSWLTMFGTLRKLKRLHVQCPSGAGLVQALSDEVPITEMTSLAVARQSDLPQNQPSAAYFPGLSELVLTRLVFDGGGDDQEDINQLSFNNLRRCLMRRYERKVGVKELHLDGCHFLSNGDVQLLAEIVENVHWDGIENFTYPELGG